VVRKNAWLQAAVELGRPASLRGITSGEAKLYITEDVGLYVAIQAQQLRPEIFLWVTEIDAEIVEELTTRSWGLRQYVIREPNGYLREVAESS
jgi:hypothetical protein